MTKWFDTNYHYLVPEFSTDQSFQLGWEQLFEEVAEARALGHQVKPVVIGPLTYLWLGKAKGGDFNKLDLLDRLLPLYGQIFQRLAEQGVEWVQIDEPILVLDLPQEWKNAFERAYNLIQRDPLKKLVATYFGGLEENLGLAANLTACRPTRSCPWAWSMAVTSGAAIWKKPWPYCSTLMSGWAIACGWHLPDLGREDQLDGELKSWLAFAVQKCEEIAVLTRAVNEPQAAEVQKALADSRAVQASRAH